jgi:hypothetical protein
MLAGMDQRQLADANTLFNVAQRLGGSIGVGLLATMFTVRVSARVGAVLGPGSSVSGSGLGSGLAGAPAALRPRITAAAVAAFHDAIWVAVAVVALGLLCALFVRPAPVPAEEPERALISG